MGRKIKLGVDMEEDIIMAGSWRRFVGSKGRS